MDCRAFIKGRYQACSCENLCWNEACLCFATEIIAVMAVAVNYRIWVLRNSLLEKVGILFILLFFEFKFVYSYLIIQYQY